MFLSLSVGKKVAVIGAGGIGFDVSEFVSVEAGDKSSALDSDEYFKEWSVDSTFTHRGGLTSETHAFHPAKREITLLQRKKTKHGKDLGKTTGWIHRATLNNKQVQSLSLPLLFSSLLLLCTPLVTCLLLSPGAIILVVPSLIISSLTHHLLFYP